MPIYEYHCDDCKEPFDLFVRSVNAAVKAVCPQCGSEHVEKAVTAASALGLGNASSFASSAASCAPTG